MLFHTFIVVEDIKMYHIKRAGRKYSDYAVLQQLIDLEYVNCIYIQYFYSVPGSYFDE